MHLKRREGISRQSNNRFSMLMFVGLCLGMFGARMKNTQVAAQTQDRQDLLNQFRTLTNETNQIRGEIAGDLNDLSEVLMLLRYASLSNSTDPLAVQNKQQLAAFSQKLVNQTKELVVDLNAHKERISAIVELLKTTQPQPKPLENCTNTNCHCRELNYEI